jgi:hypothetical protein
MMFGIGISGSKSWIWATKERIFEETKFSFVLST